MAKKILDVNETALARASDYKRIFSTEAGQRVIQDLINQHQILRPTYDAKSSDTNLMLIREGERAVILRILSILNVDPAKFLQRIKEIEENV